MNKSPMYINIYSYRKDIYKRGHFPEIVNKVVSRDIVINSIEKTKDTLDVVKAIADVLDKLDYPVSIVYDPLDNEIEKGIIKRKMYYEDN